MNDKEIAEELQMRADLSEKVMEGISGVNMGVVFDVLAYVLAQCIAQSPDMPPSKVLKHFNTRVIDLHRAINVEGDHTLQ